jgi:hypothetical protein
VRTNNCKEEERKSRKEQMILTVNRRGSTDEGTQKLFTSQDTSLFH